MRPRAPERSAKDEQGEYRALTDSSLCCTGADYGDEAAKVCERVWKEHKPDMVCNFTTGSSEFMMRGLDRAQVGEREALTHRGYNSNS